MNNSEKNVKANFFKLMKISLLLTGKKPEEFIDAEMLALGLEDGWHLPAGTSWVGYPTSLNPWCLCSKVEQ